MGTAPSTPPNYIDEVIIKDNGIVYFKLNNILIFKRTILDVLASKEKYGIDKAMNNNGLNVVICPVHCYGNSKSGRHGDDDIGLSCGGCKSSHCHSLSLEDGRVIMVSRLLANLTSPQRATERTLSLVSIKCFNNAFIHFVLSSPLIAFVLHMQKKLQTPF